MGVNCAGLRSKLVTFRKVMTELNPSVFFVQETKLKEQGKIRLNDYTIFEKLRKTRKNGGGLAIECKSELNPIWVREGDNDVETLSIDIFVKNLKIRCCTGYGCQENDKKDKKDAFWEYLDNEVLEAKKAGSGLIIQMDGNLWAGNKILKNDPRPQNSNGRLFENFLTRNSHLTVVNSLNICEGLITRKRYRNGITEQSVLEFFIVCDLILPFVKKMIIDENKRYVLTNYEHVKKGGKANDSDHATQYMDLNIKVITEKPARNEVWNFKCEKSQEIFRNKTSETDEFSNCFKSNLPVLEQIENWKKALRNSIKAAFKKVRIKNNYKMAVPSEILNLINRRNKLLKDGADKDDIEKLEYAISDPEAKYNKEKIMKQFQSFSQNPEKINLNQVWKTLKRMCPKIKPKLPAAKNNHRGEIISEPK